MGGEFSANYQSGNARFASGAATSAFNDKIYLNRSLELAIIPGVFITDTTALYGRVGASYASLTNRLNSPAGFVPVTVNTNSNSNIVAGTLGVGIKKFVTNNIAIFSEYNYHDYGTMDFPDFINFTATYSHAVRIYSQEITFGASYFFA